MKEYIPLILGYLWPPALYIVLHCIVRNVIIRRLKKAAENTAGKKDDALIGIVKSALDKISYVLFFIVCFHSAGYDVSALVTAMSGGLIGLALGFKDSIANIVASISLLFDDNVRIGETIDLGGRHKGILHGIGLETVTVIDENDDWARIIKSGNLGEYYEVGLEVLK